MYSIVKCWDVGYAIKEKSTGLYLGWLGFFDRTEDDRSREMVELFDTKKEAKKYIQAMQG